MTTLMNVINKINGGNLQRELEQYTRAQLMLETKPRSWRLRFFNWLAQGRLIIEEENKVSTNAYQSAYGQLQTVTLANPNSSMNLPGITFKITSANGGTIISVNESSPQQYTLTANGSSEELYIIPDGVEDFDRELGKIITMYRMKQK
jgi:hypothetical protein